MCFHAEHVRHLSWQRDDRVKKPMGAQHILSVTGVKSAKALHI